MVEFDYLALVENDVLHIFILLQHALSKYFKRLSRLHSQHPLEVLFYLRFDLLEILGVAKLFNAYFALVFFIFAIPQQTEKGVRVFPLFAILFLFLLLGTEFLEAAQNVFSRLLVEINVLKSALLYAVIVYVLHHTLEVLDFPRGFFSPLLGLLECFLT